MADANVAGALSVCKTAHVCIVCGKKTPPHRRGTTHRRAPELDHILPLSKGGAHSAANTQCACRECNSTKGARPLGQLLLFPSVTP